MQIKFFEESQIFHLETEHTSYLFKVGPSGELRHMWFGAAVKDEKFIRDFSDREPRSSFSPFPENLSPAESLDVVPQEYSAFGSGDYRITAAALRKSNGTSTTAFSYTGHRIIQGKTSLDGLPASFAEHKNAMTLEVTGKDIFSEAEIILSYSIFADSDVIARSVRIVNPTSEVISIEKLLSVQLDFHHSNFDLISLNGHWAKERQVYRRHIAPGIQGIGSNRGSSGHQYNPGIVLAEPSATEKNGDVYGMLLVYSGNYIAEIESSQYGSLRAVLGINPENFEWKLAPGETFQAPEALLFFSAAGLSGLSQQSHHFLTEHLIRSPWKHLRRPILINSWEAAYFDFDGEKIYSIAREAAGLGIEMLVLDDGWFGKRNDDSSSLGDWFVNTEKLGDLTELIKRINALGMKFGLWFEPEMVSENSLLYQAHPDWVIAVPGCRKSIGRSQMVLDMSRPDVVDYLFNAISALLHSAKIEYIKWDMNRNLTEVYSALLPADRQKETSHRYMLGVYELHERLLKEFPELLIEGCSGGGGRFDAGMLYYAPQIWCSDNTDAIERITIQMGTSLFYPSSAMGAHISVCPNHLTGRSVSWELRNCVALGGTFGYELDITELSSEEKQIVKKQINDYMRFNGIIREGRFFRLTEGFGTTDAVAWSWISQNRKDVLVTAIRKHSNPTGRNPEFHLRLRGLDADAVYYLDDGRHASGLTLMNAGIKITGIDRDGSCIMLYMKAE